MRLRVDSMSHQEYISAVIIGNWIWRSNWPGAETEATRDSAPMPPVSLVHRLGFTYIGMLSAENNMTYDEIYRKLLTGPLGKDLIDNLKLTKVQKVAYVADRIAAAATQEVGAIDSWYFGEIKIPVLAPYVDLAATPEVCA